VSTGAAPRPTKDLPVVVSAIEPAPSGLYRVRLQLPDGGQLVMVVPENVADLEGVRVAAGVVSLLYALGRITATRKAGKDGL
jgi:hypothetical protein